MTSRVPLRVLFPVLLGAAAAAPMVLAQTGPPLRQRGTIIEFRGMCDASAAVSLGVHDGRELFLFAGDEDNILRVYAANGSAVSVEDGGLSVSLTGRPRDEADLEGIARLGDRIYVIGSHSRNSDGEARPQRARLFAITAGVTAQGVVLRQLGRAADTLTTAIAGFHTVLRQAVESGRPPEGGGLNIEGLAAGTDDTSLFIGLRSPVLPDGMRAIVLRLDNPAGVVERGEDPRLGALIPLSLGGSGIRSMERLRDGRYVIAAGPTGPEGDFDLYLWSGREGDAPNRVTGAAELLRGLAGRTSTDPGFRFGVEAIAATADGHLLLASDDGDRPVDTTPRCKDVRPRENGVFRGVAVELPATP